VYIGLFSLVNLSLFWRMKLTLTVAVLSRSLSICILVSFDMYIHLFLRVNLSLFSRMKLPVAVALLSRSLSICLSVSFHVYIGLFSHVNMSLSTRTYVSFQAHQVDSCSDHVE